MVSVYVTSAATLITGGPSTLSLVQGEADVLACVVDITTNVVTVIDAWNPLPNHTPTTQDASQDGLCVHATSFNNGVIACLYVELSHMYIHVHATRIPSCSALLDIWLDI